MKKNIQRESYKIQVEKLSFFYGEKQALIDISLSIQDHEITALIGPSGCGKSTFLRCLNRMNDTILNTRSRGQVFLDGENINSPDTDVVDLRHRIGMVFQRPNPFPQSIFDNVAFGPRVLDLYKVKKLNELVEDNLKAVGLWDEVEENLHQDALNLSLGQQQLLCIARTLAVKPEVILMDEPCSALDPIATLQIEELMQKLKKQYCIVIVTHNMQQAARVSTNTGFFWLGRLVEFGPTKQLFTHPHEKLTEDYITGRAG